MSKKTKIITLCGSSYYCQIMAVCAWLIEKEENAISMGLHLLPDWYFHKKPIDDHLAEHEGVANQMDALHLKKIDISDEIFVVDYDNYIGNSTKREIEHATKKKKQIRWFTKDYIGGECMKVLIAAGINYAPHPLSQNSPHHKN